MSWVYSERTVWGQERPELILRESVASPLVIAGEVDVLPAQWGEILEQIGIDGEPVAR